MIFTSVVKISHSTIIITDQNNTRKRGAFLARRADVRVSITIFTFLIFWGPNSKLLRFFTSKYIISRTLGTISIFLMAEIFIPSEEKWEVLKTSKFWQNLFTKKFRLSLKQNVRFQINDPFIGSPTEKKIIKISINSQNLQRIP